MINRLIEKCTEEIEAFEKHREFLSNVDKLVRNAGHVWDMMSTLHTCGQKNDENKECFACEIQKELEIWKWF